MPDTIRRERRTLLILYVLAVYILFQLGWWGYHLIHVNEQMLEMKSIMTGQSQDAVMRKKIWMVLGEGSVFVIMLSLGFWYVKKTISRELRLAHMEKTFLLSVTHELKTPIAAIKLFLETMKSRPLSPEQSMQVINDALRETKRLQSLSENILLATKLDANRNDLLQEEVDLSELVRYEVQRHAAFTDLRFEMDVEDNVRIKGDTQLLRAMVANLVENAVKYSPSQSRAGILLRHDAQGSIRLEIRDEGKGISDAEKPLVFGKFYRSGNEQTRSSKGTGLGLYITHSIVRLHHGEISILDNKPSGTIFVIVFSNR